MRLTLSSAVPPTSGLARRLTGDRDREMDGDRLRLLDMVAMKDGVKVMQRTLEERNPEGQFKWTGSIKLVFVVGPIEWDLQMQLPIFHSDTTISPTRLYDHCIHCGWLRGRSVHQVAAGRVLSHSIERCIHIRVTMSAPLLVCGFNLELSGLAR